MTTLVLVMAAVAAPLAVLNVLSIREARANAERQAYAQFKVRADRAAEAVFDLFEQGRHLLSFMASRESMQSLEVDACRSLLAGVAGAETAYTNFALFRRDGTPVCSSEPLLSRTSFADSDWFRNGLAHGGLWLSDAQRGPRTGKVIMYMTLPVQLADQAVVGLLLLALDVERVNHILAPLVSDPSFSVVVRKGRDHVITRLPEPEKYMASALPQHVLSAEAHEAGPVRVAPGADGVSRAFAVTQLPQYDVQGVATMPEDAVYAQAKHVALRSAATALLALLLGTLAAAMASRRLAGALRSIADTARALQAGRSHVRADANLPGEFGEVAHEFNRLMDRNDERGAALQRSERQAVRVSRFYEALSAVGQAVAQGVARDELFQVACEACTKSQLALRAWVVPAGGERDLEPVASATGESCGAPRGIPTRIRDQLVSSSLKRRRCLAFADEDSGTDWAAVHFTDERTGAGVLVLRASDGDAFAHQLVQLLEELGRTISLGLDLQVNKQARDAVAAADAANRAKTAFLSHVSHELRTPLNAVIGFTDLGAARPSAQADGDLRTYLRHAGTAARRLKTLIDDLMDVSRIESGQLTVQPADVDLYTLLGTEVDLQRPAAQDRSVSLALGMQQSEPLALRTDPARLSQVIVNLLSNAIKYNRAGGSVEVSCQRETNHVRICIKDTGQGMTAQQQRRLFRPFDRLGRETTSVGGTGIGLYITKRIVESLGGELQLDSTEWVGTTVTVSLPYVPATTQRAPARRNGALRKEGDGQHPVHGTVLYIEDNPVNALLVDQWFRTTSPLVIEVRESAAAGRQAALDLRPDVILLDMHLPDVHGLACLRALKADPRTASIPVVALSADAMPQDIAAAKAAGAADYWSKPILDYKAFTAAVAAQVPAPQPAPT